MLTRSTVLRMSNVVTVSREIAAPAKVVWGMVSDITRMGEWSPEATGGRWLKGATGPSVGARFSGDNRNGSKSWSTTCTVDACEPGRSFSFVASAGPLKIARWAYTITPSATGCTVDETWTDLRGGLVKKLGKPLSGVSDRASHNRAGMEATLDRLAAAAEAAGA
jgi:uncharacterized protein YndB with AHSA1/START domain